ncbi:nucleotide-diphospho-sugar transferase [Entophlyctis helioformis]|nr:nucleotide-diphospho-sugar transferase [Entophlyctis helioformis]
MDTAIKPVFPVPELQAVILAGHGSRLYPLTERQTVPKGLLPIANRPLIWYQLTWLETAKITDIIIAVYPGSRQKMAAYVHKMYVGSGEAKITVVEVPENSGSADALRSIRGKIKTDFIVMSCDLITDMPAHHLINSFRLRSPAMTAVFYDASSLESQADRPPSSSSSTKEEDMSEFVGIDDRASRLLFTANRADIDDDLELRTSLIAKFPRVHLHSALRDAHLYVFRRWVLELLVRNKTISSVKNELVPLLLECQHRESVAKREGVDKLASLDIFERAMAHMMGRSERPLAGQALPVPDTDAASHGIFCNALVYRSGFTARANTVWSYSEVNRHMVKGYTEARVPASAVINPKTQVGGDSLVGEGSMIDERSSVKKSIIGNHCTVGKNVKITNSIIMDYVNIEDNVKLEGCVVCSNAKIGERAQLKDCEVSAEKIVAADTVGKNETYVDYLSE